MGEDIGESLRRAVAAGSAGSAAVRFESGRPPTVTR